MQWKSQQQGVTLLELMFVTIIVAILAMIALPAYSSFLLRGYHAEAQASMAQAAQFFQRVRTEQGSYKPGGNFPTLPTAVSQVPNGSVQRYNITIDTAASSGSVYVLKATPTASLPTTEKCGTLTLDSTGLKQFSNTAGDMKTCWGQ